MAGFAASIAAFVQLADNVICSHLIGAAKDAPRDMVMISSEVSSLKAILTCFSEDSLHPSTAQALPTLFAALGPIWACHNSLEALQHLLPKIPINSSERASFRMSDLTWALKESKVRKLLAELNTHKSTLLLALSGDWM
jgi:hypothetical protein